MLEYSYIFPGNFPSKMENHRFIFNKLILLASIQSFCQSVNSERVNYETKTYSEQWITQQPIRANYTPQGNEYIISNLTVYESPNRKPKRLLIAVYDILGLSTNMKQVVDAMAELYDFRVVMSDFFRGKPWDANDFPPKDLNEFQNWMNTIASWENIVKPDILTAIDDFKVRSNITQLGLFGMCWGGKVATLAATEFKEIKVAGMVHPADVENSEADGVKTPMIILPSHDEPDMLPFYRVIRKNFGNYGAVYKRFDDMNHGFAGAGGNFSDPLNAKRVKEVIDLLGHFFNYHLK